jgi:hypothetical protein
MTLPSYGSSVEFIHMNTEVKNIEIRLAWVRSAPFWKLKPIEGFRFPWKGSLKADPFHHPRTKIERPTAA